jgi:hypothetical protein
MRNDKEPPAMSPGTPVPPLNPTCAPPPINRTTATELLAASLACASSASNRSHTCKACKAETRGPTPPAMSQAGLFDCPSPSRSQGASWQLCPLSSDARGSRGFIRILRTWVSGLGAHEPPTRPTTSRCMLTKGAGVQTGMHRVLLLWSRICSACHILQLRRRAGVQKFATARWLVNRCQSTPTVHIRKGNSSAPAKPKVRDNRTNHQEDHVLVSKLRRSASVFGSFGRQMREHQGVVTRAGTRKKGAVIEAGLHGRDRGANRRSQVATVVMERHCWPANGYQPHRVPVIMQCTCQPTASHRGAGPRCPRRLNPNGRHGRNGSTRNCRLRAGRSKHSSRRATRQAAHITPSSSSPRGTGLPITPS